MSAEVRHERPGAEGTPRCPANGNTSGSSRKPSQPFVGDAAAENRREQSAHPRSPAHAGGGAAASRSLRGLCRGRSSGTRRGLRRSDAASADP